MPGTAARPKPTATAITSISIAKRQSPPKHTDRNTTSRSRSGATGGPSIHLRLVDAARATTVAQHDTNWRKQKSQVHHEWRLALLRTKNDPRAIRAAQVAWGRRESTATHMQTLSGAPTEAQISRRA